MERMRRYGRIAVPILIAGIALLAGVGLIWRTAEAARIPAGAQRALAGSGGVTAQTFVKLSAADTIVASTAVTDSVVGVCELTASANANTMYAPVGSITTVTSGELIAVGDLLTSGTGGKAFVLDTDDTSTQRICAVALSAASGADEDTTVLVVAGTAEQRLALGGAVSVTGANTFTTGTGAVTLAGNTTVSGSKTLTTGSGAVQVNGDANVAAGKDISLAAGAGYIELNGTTSGGIKIDPIDAGTAATTIANQNTSASTVSLPWATCHLPGLAPTATTSDADSLVIPVTHGVVAKTTGADAEALTLANGKPGQILIIYLATDGNGDGTLTPATKTGWSTIVFADAGDRAVLWYVNDTIGWVIVGLSGVAAPPAST